MRDAKRMTGTTHVTPADGNIFLDLGFEPEEAERMKADVDRQVQGYRAIRHGLLDELAAWIRAEGHSEEAAAAHLGVTRAKVADVLRGHAEEHFTVERLVRMVLKTGKHLEIVCREGDDEGPDHAD